VEVTVNDEWGYTKRRVSTAENGGASARSPKRRRASSPGPQKSAPKRLPSAGDSQLDADGETDPDVAEVEDELMEVSAEDAEEERAKTRYPVAANGSKKITFEDLEHFYSGNPIDIDQNTDEQVAVQKQEARPRLQSPPPTTPPPPDDAASESQIPASPTLSSSDPLFDSQSCLSDEAPEIQRDPILPHHRARAANPLIKLIDTTTLETSSKQSRITAKARLMSIHTTEISSTSGPSRGVAKRGGKPGPGRSSSGLITKNRSSLLTATKGALKSVKGKFAGTAIEHDQPDEIEEAPAAHGTTEGDKLLITSWSDEDIVVHQDQQAVSNSQGPPPFGEELLELAGLQKDVEKLPDYEDDSAAQSQDVGTQASNLTSVPAEEALPNQSSVEVTEGSKASDHIADASVSEAEQKAPTPATSDPSVPPIVTPPAEEAVKMKYSIRH
jgi:hypothetical protein